MEILRIYLDEQLLIKQYAKKHLILLKIQNMMDIKELLLRWLINFSLKRLLVVVLKVKLCRTNNY